MLELFVFSLFQSFGLATESSQPNNPAPFFWTVSCTYYVQNLHSIADIITQDHINNGDMWRLMLILLFVSHKLLEPYPTISRLSWPEEY